MKILLPFILLVSYFTPAQDIPASFYKRFEGSINEKYEITLNLIRIDSSLFGNYYYTKKGELISFIRSSIDSAGNIYLEEDAGYDEEYNPVSSGIFKGSFADGNKISGTWEKPGSDKPLKFSIAETYPSGSTRVEIEHDSRTYTDYGKASIEITMLRLTGYPDNTVQEKINKFLSPLPETGDTVEYKSTDEMMELFIQGYIADIVKDSVRHDDYIPEYEFAGTKEVLYNSGYLLSLQNVYFSYMGGAHPNTTIDFDNFDLRTGDLVKLDDIFISGYKKELNKLGEIKFREFYQVGESESLEEAGFWFEDGFNLNENFALTKAGIMFLFNQYEVGAYALGAPEVYFSFDEIKHLLKEESIIREVRK